MSNTKSNLISGVAAGLLGLGAGFWLGKRRQQQQEQHISGPRYLIVNADDFGASDGVTRGIVAAWQHGILTTTSAMVNLPDAPERIAAAHQANPRLPIGLHLNITEGRPVLPPAKVPSLVDEAGNFYNRYTIFKHLKQLSLTEVTAEINAQAQVLLEAGVEFDHIDYHHHMMIMRDDFFHAVCDLAERFDVPVRQPVPEMLMRGNIKTQRDGTILEDSSMHTLRTIATQYPNLAIAMAPNLLLSTYTRQAKTLKTRQVLSPNWLITSFYDRATLENFEAILQQLPAGVSELMTHPAYMDDLDAIDGDYKAQREAELAVLIDPAARQALEAHNVMPVRFSFLKMLS